MSNRGIVAGGVVDGTDWKLPGIVQSFGNGTNTITASTFAVLPTTTCQAQIVNSHPFARLLILVIFGAWLKGNSTTGDVRCGLNVSGSIVSTAGLGGSGANGPIGWGEVLYQTATGYNQQSSTVTYELPASPTTATFDFYAYRNGTGTVNADYPTIRIIPLRYLYPQGRN